MAGKKIIDEVLSNYLDTTNELQTEALLSDIRHKLESASSLAEIFGKPAYLLYRQKAHPTIGKVAEQNLNIAEASKAILTSSLFKPKP